MQGLAHFERLREHPAANNDVLLPGRFLQDFALEASRATGHVRAQAMTIEDDVGGRALAEVFEHAPAGVTKDLYIDAYSILVNRGVIDAVNSYIPGLESEARALRDEKNRFIESIREDGVAVHITNPPSGILEKVFPFLGRNHVKGASVDGNVFYFGGVNFIDPDKSDFMVKFTGETAHELDAAFADMHAGRIAANESRILNANTELMIDAGIPGSSIILDHATALIAHGSHSHIELVSQLLPDGALAHALRGATARGVKAELITSDTPEADSRLFGTAGVMALVNLASEARLLLSRSGLSVKKQPFTPVHAKLLMIDDAVAYFGTHNLAQSGVDAGTEEWGIFTRDRALIRNLGALYFDFRMLTDPRLNEVL